MISAVDVRNQFKGIDENMLGMLIDFVIEDWEADTGGLWNTRTDHVQVFDLTANSLIQDLRTELVPITSITSIEYSDDGITYTTLDAEGYIQLRDRIIRRVGTTWGHNYIRVTYSGGWDSSSTPANVKMALLAQMGLMEKRLAPGNIHLSSQNFEGGQGSFIKADKHPLFKRVVGSYLRIDP